MLADLSANWPMIVSVIIVIGAIYFYTRDKHPMELVSVGVLCLLLVVFYFQEFIPHNGESLSPE